MLLETLDALADRTVGDVQLLRRLSEVQVPGSGFEETKRLERRKLAGHARMIGRFAHGMDGASPA
jgi:hypothetical protein